MSQKHQSSVRSNLRNPTLSALVAKNKELARARLNRSRALRDRMKALFDDVVYPALNDTPCACVFGFPCKDPSEMSALGVQLDEFGLPLVNAMDNVSSGRCPNSEPCISTVSLRGKSLSEINRLWLADINAKRNSKALTLEELSALMRL